MVPGRDRAPGARVVAEGAVVEREVARLHDLHDIHRRAVQRDHRARALRAGVGQRRDIGAEQGDQMRAGRMPHQHRARRIAAPVLRVPLQVGDGRGHVARLHGRIGVGQHAVVDRHQHIAARQPVRRLRRGQAGIVLVALAPAAAVDHRDDRQAVRAGGRIHVVTLRRIGAIGDLAQHARVGGQRLRVAGLGLALAQQVAQALAARLRAGQQRQAEQQDTAGGADTHGAGSGWTSGAAQAQDRAQAARRVGQQLQRAAVLARHAVDDG